jgi:hypothetical protein
MDQSRNGVWSLICPARKTAPSHDLRTLCKLVSRCGSRQFWNFLATKSGSVSSSFPDSQFCSSDVLNGASMTVQSVECSIVAS